MSHICVPGHSGVFVPHTDKAGQLPSRLSSWSEYRLENYTVADFLKLAAAPPAVGSGVAMQASMPVQNTAVEKWTLDFEEFFFVNDTREAAELQMPSYAATTVFLLSQPGTVSNTHYDRSHNFYLMVGGRKRFTLIPPSEWAYMYLYPWLHPCYHQSQAHDIPDTGMEAHPAARNLSVVLEPGVSPPHTHTHTVPLRLRAAARC